MQSIRGFDISNGQFVSNALMTGTKNDLNLRMNLPGHQSKGMAVADCTLNYAHKVKKVYKPPIVRTAKLRILN